MKCKDCVFCKTDGRSSTYRRPPMYFCRRKGSLFSRNYRIGEKTRVEGEAEGCPQALFHKK